MPILLSPGVAVVEKDFTNIVPAIASSACGFAGTFAWGPVLFPTTVISENNLVSQFGKPNASNSQSFFTAANFLSYSNNLLNIRIDTVGQVNAVSNGTAVKINNPDTYLSNFSGSNTQKFAAKYPGSLGNSIGIEIADAGTYVATTLLGTITTSSSTATLTGSSASITPTNYIGNGSTTVTATIASTTGFTIGDPIIISGASEPESGKVVGTWSIASIIGATSFTFKITQQLASATYTTNLGTIVKPVSRFTSQLYIGAIVKSSAMSYTNVTTSISTKTLAGVGTSFLSQLYVGAIVKSTTGVVIGVVASIGDNSTATFVDNSTVALTNGAANVDSVTLGTVTAVTNDITATFSANSTFTVSGATPATIPWKYSSQFTSAPGTSSFATNANAPLASDELHILILDVNGAWTGTPGAVLEKYAFVSKASNAKTENGTNNYFKDVLNNTSNYVWWLSTPTTGSGQTAWGQPIVGGSIFNSLLGNYSVSLSGGVDNFVATDAEKIAAFSLFDNTELYQIAYIAAGQATTAVANYIISNIAEVRKDIIAFVSPEDVSTAAVIIGSGSVATAKINAYRNALPSTSFAAIDTGYKYQYDRYNDVYQYVPLNGDVAGLCARTDATNDPWFSPGGLNRGQIKNVVKLAVNPSPADRDALYTNGVNPVVSFPGQGVVLYGDKTMLAKPSAFDRIGVRRLFIILEKSVAIAAKFQLFEFNDGFTRNQFKNMIVPFLRDIQGRRGINDFQVVCDGTNNTDQVVMSNNFVADIYIKPNYSINYITLNFIAGRQAVAFSTTGA